MTLRRILFWIHLSTGTIASLVILVMSATGILLAYERQITEWADRDFVSPFTGQKLPMSELAERARDAAGQTPSSIRIRANGAALVEFTFEEDDQALLLDPFSGAIMRRGGGDVQRFFAAVEHWHRWLGVSRQKRDLGRNITGAANLAFLFLVGSGPFLWWPKKANWSRLKRSMFFQSEVSGRARDFNWHNVVGIWCFAPLLVIVISGVVMSYTWANNLLYRLVGSEPPPPARLSSAPRSDRARPSTSDGTARNDVDFSMLDALFARARQQVPGWERISVRLPRSHGPMTFSIETGSGGRPDRRYQLTLDPDTAAVVRWEPFSSYNAGRRLRGWFRFLHTGEAGGWMGQAVAALVTCGAMVLGWTGLSLAVHRFRGWRRA